MPKTKRSKRGKASKQRRRRTHSSPGQPGDHKGRSGHQPQPNLPLDTSSAVEAVGRLSPHARRYAAVLFQVTEGFVPTEYPFTLVLPSEVSDVIPYLRRLLLWIHMVARLGLLRQRAWVYGVALSIVGDCYLPCAANLRGLLESAGDICYSLDDAPQLVGRIYRNAGDHISALRDATGSGDEKYQPIREDWEPTLPKLLELNDRLRHFLFAGKWKWAGREDQRTDLSESLRTIEYVDVLEHDQGGPIHHLYRTLCDEAHPASLGLRTFVLFDPEAETYVVRWNPQLPYMQHLGQEHREAIEHILDRSLGACLLTLVALNRFVDRFKRLDELYTPLVDEDDLSISDNWTRDWQGVEALFQPDTPELPD